jgi:glutathione S-transferase
MNLVDLVAVAAIVQLIVFGVLVAKARDKYKVQAPAISGHEMFDRAFRVHMNTQELMIAFLPALYLAAKYWPPTYVASCGAVYIVGRLVYRAGYLAAPGKRKLGFLLSFIPIIVLLLAAVAGVFRGIPSTP